MLTSYRQQSRFQWKVDRLFRRQNFLRLLLRPALDDVQPARSASSISGRDFEYWRSLPLVRRDIQRAHAGHLSFLLQRTESRSESFRSRNAASQRQTIRLRLFGHTGEQQSSLSPHQPLAAIGSRTETRRPSPSVSGSWSHRSRNTVSRLRPF